MHQIPALEVYLDLLFILNFCMDYFIFWMVSKITYKKITQKRLILGSFIAATLYCLVVIVPFLRTLNIITYLILLPLIPIKIIFKPINTRQWIQTYIITNITALIVGGMSYGMIYWIQEQGLISNQQREGSGKFSVGILMASIVGSYIIIRLYGYYMQQRNTGIQQLYGLKIRSGGHEVNVEALLDTGNKVYDPITKYPVIIVEYKMLQGLLPEGIQSLYLNKEEDIVCIVEEASKHEFGSRIRLIPYHSLGNPNGFLLGFRADEVYVSHDELEDKLIPDVIIGIYQHSLTTEGTYHGLLHADVMS